MPGAAGHGLTPAQTRRLNLVKGSTMAMNIQSVQHAGHGADATELKVLSPSGQSQPPAPSPVATRAPTHATRFRNAAVACGSDIVTRGSDIATSVGHFGVSVAKGVAMVAMHPKKFVNIPMQMGSSIGLGGLQIVSAADAVLVEKAIARGLAHAPAGQTAGFAIGAVALTLTAGTQFKTGIEKGYDAVSLTAGTVGAFVGMGSIVAATSQDLGVLPEAAKTVLIVAGAAGVVTSFFATRHLYNLEKREPEASNA
jgi:hypothetical protein